MAILWFGGGWRISEVRIDLMAYLFGDILSVAWSDFLWIGLGLFFLVGLLGWRWLALLTCTLNRDLAQAEGINLKRVQLVLTLALAVIVALGIQVVGAILIAALLIIPAAAAQFCKYTQSDGVDRGGVWCLCNTWLSCCFISLGCTNRPKYYLLRGGAVLYINVAGALRGGGLS